MPKPLDAQTLQRIAAGLRDYPVTDARAAQLAVELARINDAARSEGAHNDFNAQPTDFAVTLATLARKVRR